MKKLSRNIWGTILRIVLLLVSMVTPILVASIYPMAIPWKPVFASPDTEHDYVDSQSNVDLSTDVGTHSNFTTQQYTDLINDTLTEANTNTTKLNEAENFVDDNSSNVDGHTGHGTSSNFTAQQDANIAFNDTLTEVDTVGGGTSGVFTDGFEANNFNLWDGNGATTWVISTTQKYAGTYSARCGSSNDGYLTSDDIDMSGASQIGVGFWIYDHLLDNADGYLYYYDGSAYDQIVDLNSITTSENTWIYYTAVVTDSQYFKSNFRIRFYETPETNELCYIDNVVIDKTIPANYELDLEFEWTTADFDEANEYLCIRTNSFTGIAENLGVDVWSGGAWVSVSNALTASAWNNISITTHLTDANITFRFIGKTETSDTAQNTWTIECNLIHTWSVGLNYELDIEEQFTNANSSRTNRELCIRMGAMNGESLSVQWWNTTSSSWLTIIASLSANVWNNVSVTAYLTADTFTIKFIDGTKVNDLVQSTWSKDACLLHTWDIGYLLNLRVLDFDSVDAISNAVVYVNTNTKTSDVNGWANWTLVSGTVHINVSYYGFWINGTFSVTMDSDKTIDVQCNLYDVTITVKETVQDAILHNANVTVFNSTSDEANKIATGITGSNGVVELLNLPNYTLTFTQYGGSSYTIVIGNATQLVSNENQTFIITADQNYVNTNNSYSIIAFAG